MGTMDLLSLLSSWLASWSRDVDSTRDAWRASNASRRALARTLLSSSFDVVSRLTLTFDIAFLRRRFVYVFYVLICRAAVRFVRHFDRQQTRLKALVSGSRRNVRYCAMWWQKVVATCEYVVHVVPALGNRNFVLSFPFRLARRQTCFCLWRGARAWPEDLGSCRAAARRRRPDKPRRPTLTAHGPRGLHFEAGTKHADNSAPRPPVLRLHVHSCPFIPLRSRSSSASYPIERSLALLCTMRTSDRAS